MCALPLHAHIYGRPPSERPLITPARPRLALQSCTNHLLRTLWPCLPARSHRHLLWLWRRQHRRPRRTHLGTAQCRSNAPGITSSRQNLAL